MDRITAAMEWSTGNVSLFGDDDYVLVDSGKEQAQPGYPRPIAADWPGVFETGIDTAVLWNNGKAYFFRSDQYVRYDVATDRADPGYPQPIAAGWPGLFERDIDAGILWNNGKAYFFKGADYVRYDVATDRVDPGYPKPIAGNWPGVFEQDLDACVNWLPGKVLFFRGGQYLGYDVAADTADGSSPKPVPEDWLRPSGEIPRPADPILPEPAWAIDDLVRTKLDANTAVLMGTFPEWNDWPADARLGVLSMAWGFGAGFPARFARFTAAASAHDWKAAAAECHIDATGNPGVVPRNEANRQLFVNAGAVEAKGLDRGTLYYPAEARPGRVARCVRKALSGIWCRCRGLRSVARRASSPRELAGASL